MSQCKLFVHYCYSIFIIHFRVVSRVSSSSIFIVKSLIIKIQMLNKFETSYSEIICCSIGEFFSPTNWFFIIARIWFLSKYRFIHFLCFYIIFIQISKTISSDIVNLRVQNYSKNSFTKFSVFSCSWDMYIPNRFNCLWGNSILV